VIMRGGLGIVTGCCSEATWQLLRRKRRHLQTLHLAEPLAASPLLYMAITRAIMMITTTIKYLAMATRCFSPPLSLRPRSPTNVL
jgi:hypothetical protein